MITSHWEKWTKVAIFLDKRKNRAKISGKFADYSDCTV
jgi:hypothetical protein